MKKEIFAVIAVILMLAGCLEKKDRTAPTIKFSIDGKKGEENWYVSSVKISMEAYDNESKVKELKYRINGDLWRDYVMPFTLQKNGFYFVEFYAKDSSGNENYANITIKIDSTSPSINFTNFEAGYIYFRGKKTITPRIPHDTIIIGDFTIEVEAKDNLAGVKKVEFYMGKGIAFEDESKPYEWEIKKAMGVYNITAVAYDYAGNYASITIPEVQIFNLF